MKKLITLAVALLLTITSFCQKAYVAKQTEIYKWNTKKNEWQFSSSNKNVEIPIYIYKRFIHIHAKDHAYFLLEEESEDISGNTFQGLSYNAYEFVTESKCEIHIVESKTGESMISIVWFSEGINLRYFFK
jgi:hypothetical protein